MNLGKLLAAGKSIAGGRRQVSYHVVERAFLPKFISPKNPFTPPAKVAAPSPAAASVKETAAADERKTQKPAASLATRPRRRTWLGKLNSVSFRGGSSSEPQKPLCPRQAELSLDRVKVVHNDLSDVDVEVVPIKSRSAPEASSVPARGGDSWSRLGAKIFGVKAA